MITYFPEIYPEELYYSVASRYYAGNGFFSCTQMGEDFYEDIREVPDFRFINRLQTKAIEHLCKNNSFEQFLQEHTLLNYYGRFLGVERRNTAYSALVNMEGDYGRRFPVNKSEAHLKYCPLCVIDNRKKYGEAYWRVIHQIPELTVCPIHGCRLIHSIAKINYLRTNNFNPLEITISDMTITFGSQKEIELAQYLYEIVKADYSLEYGTNISKYLSCKLAGTKYSTSRGKTINVSVLVNDLVKYYSDFETGIKKNWHVLKMLNGKRANTFEIAQVGMFLKISPEELIKAELPCKLPEQIFDERVMGMFKKGMSIHDIATELKTSQDLIRSIARRNGVKSNKHTEAYLKRKAEEDKAKIEEYRKLWLEALSEYPQCSLAQILKYKKYMIPLKWLRRKDREWTDKHYPRK